MKRKKESRYDTRFKKKVTFYKSTNKIKNKWDIEIRNYIYQKVKM